MTPALPPGFELDDAPALPAGFVLDGAPAPAAPKGSRARAQQQSDGLLTKNLLNLIPGFIRGAGSIGATVLAKPEDLGAAILRKPGETDYTRRLSAMDGGLQELGADPTSPGYAVGKVGAEVLGTAGVGGGLANVAAKVAPNAAARAAPVLDALRTGGFRAGGATGLQGVGARATGGAINGGASTALVDPQSARTGAMIGGALPVATKVAGYAGQKTGQAIAGTTKTALGLSTGVGAEAVGEAFRAGRLGKTDFVDNMRGSVPLNDVLDRAKQGLQTMGAAKSAEYRSGMIPIKGDQTVLSLGGIDQAVQDAASVTTFKGQVKNDAAAGAVAKMRAAVDEWKALDPAQFHTPEGLDALKQKLGGIVEGIPFEEKTARLAAGKIYSATKESIEKQAPTYAKVMKDYSEASQLISEIERALSLKPNASVDTSMRKLQSLMRNNVQTNYGGRLSLAKELEQKGGVDLMPSIAGQAMNSLAPRSLTGQMGGGATAFMAMQNPLMLAAMPFQMPRVVGETAYGLGRAVGGVAGGGNALMQAVSKNPQLAALLSNPNALSDLGQFAYRSAPVLATSR